MTESQIKEHRSELIWGVVLVLGGVVFLLSNFEIIKYGSLWRHWPFAFVGVGLLKLIAVRSLKEVGSAMWWVFIGGYLYVSVFNIFGLGFSRSWPILIIGWGISTLWNAFTRKPHHVWY
jgi:hypothetical protein